MKKLILVAALIAGSFSMNAQFYVGVNAGVPGGDASSITSFTLGVDATYMLSAEEDFNYGLSAGYLNFFGKTVAGFKVPNVSFIPLAFSGRYNTSEKFMIGADVGYAVGASSGTDGGFYYRPMVGYSIGENTTLSASYSGISVNSANVSTFGLGIMFGI